MLLALFLLIGILAYIVGRKIYLRREYDRVINELTFDKSFDVDLCTKEELVARCEELNLSKETTALAIKLFIEKTKQSVLADELCIEEKSVQTQKRRLKNKLNTKIP